jgi:uncharacterized protein
LENRKARAVKKLFGSSAGFLLAPLFLWCFPVLAAGPCVLVYQKNGKGFVHDNLAASAAAIVELGKQDGFDVDVSTNAAIFTEATLKKYATLIFANSNNEAFESEEQRAAFQRYVRNGGGFVGIHSSTGSERQWDYFQRMQGAKFFRHSPLQKFTIKVLDSKHLSTAHLGDTWLWTDECYFFTNLNPDIHVLLAAQTTTLRDAQLEIAPGQKVENVFPLAWCHEFDGGRQFYTSLGHRIEHYSDPIFRQHLLGGIRWVLNQTKSQQANHESTSAQYKP